MGARTSRRTVGLLLAALVWLVPSRALAQSETTEYYGLDTTGSVRVVFDAAGTVVTRVDYGPFGEQLAAAPGAPNDKYAGLFRDDETGLDYAQARQYNPRIGRFTSLDPVYSGLFEPQRWNRYAYALNSPLTLVDPEGLNVQSHSTPGCVTFPDQCYAAAIWDEWFWLSSGTGGGTGGGGIGRGGTTTGGTPTTTQTTTTATGGTDTGTTTPPPTVAPPPKYCTASKYASARRFVKNNFDAATEVARDLETASSNILGLAGFESGWGTGPLIAGGTNNFFSLTAGPAFALGATGQYKQGTYTFQVYPNFRAAGRALANSYIGSRVRGVRDPVEFARALNAGNKFNSEARSIPYNTVLVGAITVASGVTECQ